MPSDPRPAARLADDRGTIAGGVYAILVVTLLIGVIGFQVGRAGTISASAQTGSDAAALAAGEDLRAQIIQWMATTAGTTPFVPSYGRAAAAAHAFAARNDVVIADLRFAQSGPLSFDVHVTARNVPAGALEPLGGEPGEIDGRRATRDATARVALAFVGALARAPGGGGGGAAGTTSAGACRIGDAVLEAVAREAGVPEAFAREGHPGSGGSVLTRYTRCDGPGVSVSGLQRPMQVSLLKLEAQIGQPLQLSSAYRSPAYQAQLCPQVAGPCAAPGRSLHNYGLAVDVANWQVVAAAVNADPSIGLCQPLPSNDAVHFSHATGAECGGRTGAGRSAPALFGGNVLSVIDIEVALIE